MPLGIKRNWRGIRHEKLRQKVDPMFNALHDRLEVCYYDYWVHGKHQDYYGYDLLPDPAETKKLFDSLHGLIFEWRELMFWLARGRDAARQKRIEKAIETILALRTRGIDLTEHVRAFGERLGLEWVGQAVRLVEEAARDGVFGEQS